MSDNIQRLGHSSIRLNQRVMKGLMGQIRVKVEVGERSDDDQGIKPVIRLVLEVRGKTELLNTY